MRLPFINELHGAFLHYVASCTLRGCYMFVFRARFEVFLMSAQILRIFLGVTKVKCRAYSKRVKEGSEK